MDPDSFRDSDDQVMDDEMRPFSPGDSSRRYDDEAEDPRAVDLTIFMQLISAYSAAGNSFAELRDELVGESVGFDVQKVIGFVTVINTFVAAKQTDNPLTDTSLFFSGATVSVDGFDFSTCSQVEFTICLKEVLLLMSGGDPVARQRCAVLVQIMVSSYLSRIVVLSDE